MFLVIKFLGEVKILLPNYICIILNCKWEKMPWHTLFEILGSPLVFQTLGKQRRHLVAFRSRLLLTSAPPRSRRSCGSPPRSPRCSGPSRYADCRLIFLRLSVSVIVSCEICSSNDKHALFGLPRIIENTTLTVNYGY